MKQPPKLLTKTCAHCSQEFTRPDWKVWRAALYCSSACYDEARRTLSPEQRAALMTNATARIRGAKRSHQDLCNRAAGKQRAAKLSADEVVIHEAMLAAGLSPVPLMAVDKFNVDFAFPEDRLAVEYNGGNWHNTAKKRAQVEAKRAFLTSQGWHVIELPRLDKPQANDAGNQRMEAADMVALVQFHLNPPQ